MLGLGQHGRVLQLQAEVTNAAQQSVQLRLVGDLADEVGVAAAVHRRHPVEGACQPRITVYQNGIKIQDNVSIPVDNTRAGLGGNPCTPGPIMLQDHGNPVQFRNVWLLPLSAAKAPG